MLNSKLSIKFPQYRISKENNLSDKYWVNVENKANKDEKDEEANGEYNG